MTRQYTSDPRGKKFLSAAAFVITIIIIAVLNALRKYAADKFPQYMPDSISLPEKVITGFMIAFAVIYVIYISVLLPLWYKSLRYVINDREIIARSGIFSRTYRIMKRSAVQHAVKISMPFSKVTCFNFITLSALGGRMTILFLSDRACNEIMSLFRQGRRKPPLPAPPQIHSKEQYSVKYSSDGGNDYVFTDNSEIYTQKELTEVLGDFENVTQLTFSEIDTQYEQSEGQLTFGDFDTADDDREGLQ